MHLDIINVVLPTDAQEVPNSAADVHEQ